MNIPYLLTWHVILPLPLLRNMQTSCFSELFPRIAVAKSSLLANVPEV
ncbi:MAG: hypothetical protein Nkreftii_001241 [Candidatus Nitrospira kreftii]|uniref:Uncharacterized protein n=1 Tax=Candidatus Nitrospira kreftii TaxID=2652173 RepID=A0A7S8IXY3_9BACT|nr:MAG: hypothetical protein Nkreftii_001241 [Candidatus Nitrospira kreftii]